MGDEGALPPPCFVWSLPDQVRERLSTVSRARIEAATGRSRKTLRCSAPMSFSARHHAAFVVPFHDCGTWRDSDRRRGRVMRILRRIALVCLMVVLVPVLLAVLGTLVPHPFVRHDDAPFDRRILVVSNTIHTDIAVPADAETLAALAFLADTGPPIDHPDARWLLIGWGGRSFYLETPTLADIKPGPAFRALTIDSSVMHVDVFSHIDTTHPDVTEIAVSEAAYANLLAQIADTFVLTDGRVEPIADFAFGTNDKFYEAKGMFNVLLGCNLWTSRMLRSAGITSGLWNPLPSSLTTSLRLFNGTRLVASGPD